MFWRSSILLTRCSSTWTVMILSSSDFAHIIRSNLWFAKNSLGQAERASIDDFAQNDRNRASTIQKFTYESHIFVHCYSSAQLTPLGAHAVPPAGTWRFCDSGLKCEQARRGRLTARDCYSLYEIFPDRESCNWLISCWQLHISVRACQKTISMRIDIFSYSTTSTVLPQITFMKGKPICYKNSFNSAETLPVCIIPPWKSQYSSISIVLSRWSASTPVLAQLP